MQNQIRNNADELSNALGVLGKWEKAIVNKDEALKQKASHTAKAPRGAAGNNGSGNSGVVAAPSTGVKVVAKMRAGAGTVTTTSSPAAAAVAAVRPIEIKSALPLVPRNDYNVGVVRPDGMARPSSSLPPPALADPVASSSSVCTPGSSVSDTGGGDEKSMKASSAAKHTYDVGYKKWETFNVEAALAAEGEGEGEGDVAEFDFSGVTQDVAIDLDGQGPGQEASPVLTPASFYSPATAASVAAVPKALGVHTDRDTESAEREIGNSEYAKGNFTAAIKCYTKCLGLKSNNYVAFSNRAMAFLKTKEYFRAEQDCNIALQINNKHTKSFQRRATARNMLGKHRAALNDLYTAQNIVAEDPAATAVAQKQFKADILKTQELLKAAVQRAPLVKIPVHWDGEQDVLEVTESGVFVVEGPDLPRQGGPRQ